MKPVKHPWKPAGLLPLLLLLTLIAGCSKSEENKQAAPEKPATTITAPVAATPANPAALQPQPVRLPQSGKVIEERQAAPYTFVQIESDGVRYWLATNPSKPKVGEMVHWDQFTVKREYHSKVLNQTFPMVLFVGALLPGPAPNPQTSSKGKVHAVLQSGGYTYVQIGSAAGSWLAAPTTRIKEGDVVVWSPGTTMKNFTSKTLNRTFTEIQFLSGIKVTQSSVVAKPPEPPPGKPLRQSQRPPQQENPPARPVKPASAPTASGKQPPQKPAPTRPAPATP